MAQERPSQHTSADLPATESETPAPASYAASENAASRPSAVRSRGRVRSLLAAGFGEAAPAALRRTVRSHPGMTVAVVLSIAIPLAVAWFPAGSGNGSDETALDKLPMPGRVRFHDGAQPVPVKNEPNASSALARQSFEPGWDVPQPQPGVPASRFANYRDDIDPPLQRDTIGAAHAIGATPRGAWLTGEIEEAPQSRGSGAPLRGFPPRRH